MTTPSAIGRRAVLLGAAAMGLAGPALAQGAAPWPSRPIRFIVPFAPGGASDTTARLTGQHLSQRLGQPVVVENKAGAASVIGTAEAARAAPDGHTILLAPPPFVITQFAYPNLPYDPETAFRPVILLVTSPSLLFSRTGLATRGWPEILEMAKARPGVLTYGSPGNGSLPHLAMELLKLRAGVDILHVPYRGGGPAAADLAGGRIDLMISSPLDMAGNLAGGRAVPIAAATARRARAFPDLPTLGELGVPDYDSAGWFGVVMPAATPDAIATRLNAEFQAVLQVEEVAARLLTLGVEPAGGSAEDFQRHLTAERNRWRVAVPAAGVTVQ
ncbi:tripartite tricarboxylate transporter substrate binding protein [Falsiroseomonas sp.]|uniref:Bug family tripartite tricarboxylate transporter substrate binding protein n=1 Tax=Falsiroseomonas sp. TaxID=2870721 RepID=UPI002734816A|nr:tripartite tricarboxylate transporter substrate-binding protein [Falsiroseomonas sp.]MDP3416475.1 tripartite tricarboxylate transporter substrate-binding protein [Falsiroseomonas sp.]